MKLVKQAGAFSLFLMALCGCEEQSITRQEPTAPSSQVVASPAPASFGDIIGNVPSLPSPTIIEQTYVPPNELFAHTRCRAWRITWPTYPANTNPSLIPTVFTVSNGGLNSFHFLNNIAASTTYKTTFNLYNLAKLESANTLWSELKYVSGAGDKMETTWFYKTDYSAKTIENLVKGRPSHFELYWNDALNVNNTELTYQQGDVFLYRLLEQNRYGGIRIVSMTPRIIEVYLAEPNN